MREEFQTGHIPGAVSIPIHELRKRLHELPRRKEFVAYCRGRYCVFSDDAVALLAKEGFRARRFELGVLDWKFHGFPVEGGAAAGPIQGSTRRLPRLGITR